MPDSGQHQLSTIERALQLARSGSFGSVESVREVLTREGYSGVRSYISGSLAKQVSAEIAKARAIMKERSYP